MSVDLFYDYIFKGNSETLAQLVEKHFSMNYFCSESLGVDYPECFDYTNPLSPEEIRSQDINEIKIRMLIVFRAHFIDQHIDETLVEAFKNQYPDLEISRHYVM